MRLRLPRRTRPTGSGVFAKTLLLRYAVSDIVLPSTALESRFKGLGISPHGISALTHDIFRPLVIPQAEESRVSQLASLRPLGESDLSDELRLQPVHAASRQPVLGKGRNRRLQPCELLA